MISFLLGTIRNEKHLQALRDITFNLNNKFKCELRTVEENGRSKDMLAILEVSQFPEDNPENFTFDGDNYHKGEFYQYASEMIIYQFSRYIGVMYSEKDD